jgi:hypothetical protein
MILKEQGYQVNNLMLYLKKLEKTNSLKVMKGRK